MCHINIHLNVIQLQLWLVWLSWLSASLQTKGHWFNSRSGHMPGLRARSLAGDMQEATNRCYSPSLPPFPSL